MGTVSCVGLGAESPAVSLGASAAKFETLPRVVNSSSLTDLLKSLIADHSFTG